MLPENILDQEALNLYSQPSLLDILSGDSNLSYSPFSPVEDHQLEVPIIRERFPLIFESSEATFIDEKPRSKRTPQNKIQAHTFTKDDWIRIFELNLSEEEELEIIKKTLETGQKDRRGPNKGFKTKNSLQSYKGSFNKVIVEEWMRLGHNVQDLHKKFPEIKPIFNSTPGFSMKQADTVLKMEEFREAFQKMFDDRTL